MFLGLYIELAQMQNIALEAQKTTMCFECIKLEKL